MSEDTDLKAFDAEFDGELPDEIRGIAGQRNQRRSQTSGTADTEQKNER